VSYGLMTQPIAGFGNFIKVAGSPSSETSGASGRDAPAIRMRTVRQRFGEMNATHALVAVEVGEGAGDLHDPMKSAGRQAHGVGRVSDERKAVAVRAGDLFEEGRRAGGVRGDPLEPQARVAAGLAVVGDGDPRRDFGRALRGRRQDEVGRRVPWPVRSGRGSWLRRAGTGTDR
jgi:hypothetical protein